MTITGCLVCGQVPCVCYTVPAPLTPWPSMLGTPIVVPLDHRQAFIREAAIRLCASLMNRRTPEQAWQEARALWDAKPEDC